MTAPNPDPDALARSLGRIYGRMGVSRALAKSPANAQQDAFKQQMEPYRNDPVGFARDILGQQPTADQQMIIRAFPGRVKVNSGHGLGKSHGAAMLACWWYYTRNPGVVIITAPTAHHISTVLWAEIRIMLGRACVKAPGKLAPSAAVLFDHDDHWMQGYTSSKGESFQGRHRSSMFFIFDECHDDQTEVMTKDGWRMFAELTGKEELMTMDPRTSIAEFVKPLRIVKNWHVGDMMHYKCSGSDFCVTPGHRMLWQDYLKPPNEKWERDRMDEIAQFRGYLRMTRTFKWTASDVSTYALPQLESRGRYEAFPERVLPMDTWLEFLGWYCSEGNLIRGEGGKLYGIAITQKDKGTLRYITTLGEKLGFHPRLYLEGETASCTSQLRIHNAQLGAWAGQWGGDCLNRRVPDFIRHLSSRQIGIFLEAYIEGDGTRYKYRDIIYTSSKQMASGLNELILKTGVDSTVIPRGDAGRNDEPRIHGRLITSTVEGFLVSRAKRAKNIKFDPRVVQRVPYRGYVYCAELPKHHVLYTRRNGRVLWSSNCEGLEPVYWETTGTMYKPGEDHSWFAIGNPVTTASQSFLEDMAEGPDGKPKWKLHSLSALNHPNVLAQLKGEPPPVPNAVTLPQVEQWVRDWTDPVSPKDQLPTDLEWPPNSGIFLRPGPQFKARVQGIRPTEGVDTVWSALAWERACTPKFTTEHCWWQKWGITIGVDSATYGEDDTVLHVRSGGLSLHHEAHNGWLPDKTADRIKELCFEYAEKYNSWAVIPTRPKLTKEQVKVIIELDGPGVGVLSHCHQFGDWMGIKVAASSERYDSLGRSMYQNQRSELWFNGKDMAMRSEMDLSRLPQDVLKRLQRQLLTPSYRILPNGATAVESKDDIKERLKRSPDDADAMLVCYWNVTRDLPSVIGETNNGQGFNYMPGRR